jgi:hypothetical protein
MTWFLVAVVIVAVVAIAVLAMRRQRSEEMRRRFGPTYERALDRHGDRRSAESELRRQLERHDAEVRDLAPEVRDRLCARWRVVQVRFVDDPHGAVAEAASLVEMAMVERGYIADGDGADDPSHERYDLVAFDHPALIDRYRTDAAATGTSSVDALRDVFVHHRELFEALVQERHARRVPASRS